jgi:5-methylcytosine-specific restriction endonuclease McrA
LERDLIEPYPFFHFGEEWIKKEKEKAKKLKKTAWWRKKTAKGNCYYCKRTFKPNELTMDHIIPLSRGGMSTKENLVPCCKECNRKKKYLLPIEWEEYMNQIRAKKG